MGQWTFLWLTVILFYHTRASDVRFPTNRNGDRFTSLIVKSDTGTIYVAENRLIHRLDMDLKESKKSISTCDGKDCENINKVMTMDNDLLIICGTGKNNTCQALNGSTVQNCSSGEITDENYLVVSTDVNRPAVGLGLNGYFYLGVTYGSGFRTQDKTYKYLISRTLIREQFSPVGTVTLKDPNNENNDIKDSYIVFFRKVFYHKGFVYFLTNQRFNLDAKNSSSKLVRICVNETYETEMYANNIRSYTDIVLTCDVDGYKYNLLQDAEFLSATGILVAFFAKGDNPENPTSENAVCIYTIDAVNDAVLEAKKSFFTTCTSQNQTVQQFAYLDPDRDTCLSSGNYEDFVCPQAATALGVEVIGNTFLSPNSTRKVEGTAVKITKVKGIERYDSFPDIYCGTDNGTVIKFSVDESLQIFQYQGPEQIDKGHSVKDIRLTEDHAYILTSRKLFKRQERDCPKFKTCQDTLNYKNPSCGWCIIENRSSKKTNCSDQETWLSSLSTCVTAEVSPRYIPVATPTNITLQLSENVPRISQQLLCRYFKGNNAIGPNVPAIKITDQSMQCTVPAFGAFSACPEYNCHLKSEQLQTWYACLLQDYVVQCPRTITLPSANFDCASCLVSANCRWCSEDLRCNTTCQSSGTVTEQNCPRLLNNTDIYLPSGRATVVSLQGQNLVGNLTYKCKVNESYITDAILDPVNSRLNCSINVSVVDFSAKTELPVAVLQKKDEFTVKVEDDHNNTITVYRCEMLGEDCTMCKALKTDIYECHWCMQNHCGPKLTCQPRDDCPQPNITEVKPPNIGYKGRPPVTIIGTNLGTVKDTIKDIRVGSLNCTSVEFKRIDGDFDVEINKEISCSVNALGDETLLDKLLNVTFSFNGDRVGTGHLTLRDPKVTLVDPKFGPQVGGTLVRLYGNHFGIGSEFEFVQLVPFSVCLNIQRNNSVISCTTPSSSAKDSPVSVNKITIRIDHESYNSKISENVYFSFLPSPVIEKYATDNSIVSGGTILNATGRNLMSAATIAITAEYAGEITVNYRFGGLTVNLITRFKTCPCKKVFAKNKLEDNKLKQGACTARDATSITCTSPEAPESVKNEMEENIAGGEGDASTNDASIDVKVTIKMDGYEDTFTLRYVRDPDFYIFSEFDETRVFLSSPSDLIIKGERINLAAKYQDYQISIGMRGRCLVTQITESNLTCIPPALNPDDDAEKLQVVVKLGFFTKSVGYVKYDFESAAEAVMNILRIVLPILGSLTLIGVLVAIFGGVKYRRVKTKAKKFEDNLANMEMQIKKVFREEFLDMHTTMSRVNESLIEKGFPYNSYQRYSFLMMFPGEWNMEEHPLMHEPVVSKRQVSDAVRVKLKRGMEAFEELLLNKFFLLSVISTMEKQKKFFLKEKSNMAGYLSVGLLCKMDYFHEILSVLLTNLVSDTQAKSQKTLFRRCESITEKLLSNWLVMSLYPHVKMHSGSPLYMLLKGTQLTMESGPIDAITGDSKYTLSEEKLLKQDDKPNTLTLKIMVDNSDEIQDCKVLDCDTISQVKAKCLSQIYVNFPASQLTVDSSELNLEWHWGIGGRIVIKDEDTSSKREGEWLQLNTLEHYRVQDGSSMALVDPHGMAEQEDYVNLAQIRIDTDPGCDSSIHSNEPLAPRDEEDGGLIIRWHLVKPETDQQKPGTVAIDELYLSRLITTKQSVLEFMKNLFDTILNNTIPPPAKFLFDLLDELGEQNKIDPDSVHAWKSQCYLIRFWATLINKPYNLFDQRIPSYVETSMEVISQVLIESCSLKAQQYTKDSSPAKLVFKNDMMSYRDKVKDYYARVKDHQQSEEDLRQYLTDLNRFQHQQLSFNKQAALYTLYNQLQPYMEEIMDDLENNSETKSLHLDRKLANLNNSMQED